MIQKVLRVGTSIAVTVPKAAAEELGLKAGDAIAFNANVKTGEFSYRIAKKRAGKSREAKIAALTLNFVDRYRKDLEALKDR